MIVLSSALFYLQDDFRVPSLVQRLLLKENDKDLHASYPEIVFSEFINNNTLLSRNLV